MIKFIPRNVSCWSYPIFNNDGEYIRDELMFDFIHFKDISALKRFLKVFYNYNKEPEFEINDNSVIYGLLVGWIEK